MAFCCKINRSRRFSLICMLVMTTSFFFAEIAVGYATNSMALVADSFHMLSDVISLVVGLVAVIYSDKSSKTNTYGWARAEVLGALCNAVFLLALCFSIVVEAIQRLVQVEPITQPLLVLGVGGAGLVINLIGLLLFHEHAHGHSHDHGHNHNHSQSHDHSKNHDHEHHDDNDHEHPDGGSDSDTLSEKHSSEIKGGHLNMKGVFLHVLGDALGSVVVIASALAVHFIQADWKFYVDPVMSLLIAIIIVCSTLPLLRQSAFILLQKPPPHIKAEEIEGKLTKIKGVVSVHDLHIWQLSGNRAVASAHVTMHAGDDFAATALRLRHVFHDVGVHSLTLQPEYYPCAKGRSVCGVSDCSFLKEETENFLPNVLNEGEIAESDEGRVMDSLPQNEYSCDTPTSDYPERSPVNQPCKFSCVSNDCAAYMCCDGLRKKKELLSSVVIGEDNPAYGMGPIMVESVSVRV